MAPNTPVSSLHAKLNTSTSPGTTDHSAPAPPELELDSKLDPAVGDVAEDPEETDDMDDECDALGDVEGEDS